MQKQAPTVGRLIVMVGLSVRALAEASLAAGPVSIDARDLTAEQRERLVGVLEDAARAA